MNHSLEILFVLFADLISGRSLYSDKYFENGINFIKEDNNLKNYYEKIEPVLQSHSEDNISGNKESLEGYVYKDNDEMKIADSTKSKTVALMYRKNNNITSHPACSNEIADILKQNYIGQLLFTTIRTPKTTPLQKTTICSKSSTLKKEHTKGLTVSLKSLKASGVQNNNQKEIQSSVATDGVKVPSNRPVIKLVVHVQCNHSVGVSPSLHHSQVVTVAPTPKTNAMPIKIQKITKQPRLCQVQLNNVRTIVFNNQIEVTNHPHPLGGKIWPHPLEPLGAPKKFTGPSTKPRTLNKATLLQKDNNCGFGRVVCTSTSPQVPSLKMLKKIALPYFSKKSTTGTLNQC